LLFFVAGGEANGQKQSHGRGLLELRARNHL
jgi:hypothetical protein